MIAEQKVLKTFKLFKTELDAEWMLHYRMKL